MKDGQRAKYGCVVVEERTAGEVGDKMSGGTVKGRARGDGKRRIEVARNEN